MTLAPKSRSWDAFSCQVVLVDCGHDRSHTFSLILFKLVSNIAVKILLKFENGGVYWPSGLFECTLLYLDDNESDFVNYSQATDNNAVNP